MIHRGPMATRIPATRARRALGDPRSPWHRGSLRAVGVVAALTLIRRDEMEPAFLPELDEAAVLDVV